MEIILQFVINNDYYDYDANDDEYDDDYYYDHDDQDDYDNDDYAHVVNIKLYSFNNLSFFFRNISFKDFLFFFVII